MELHDILETLMIVCFGVSWPMSISTLKINKRQKPFIHVFYCIGVFVWYNIKADVAYIQSGVLVLFSQYHYGVDGYRIVLQESTI
jgi:hypothetical protein